ncbi:hypothetical protein O1L44_31595 [Streptomyces noursei]|nr:hypothetical protein [Streptomyces noursei]
MEEDGVISGYRAVIDSAAIGRGRTTSCASRSPTAPPTRSS